MSQDSFYKEHTEEELELAFANKYVRRLAPKLLIMGINEWIYYRTLTVSERMLFR